MKLMVGLLVLTGVLAAETFQGPLMTVKCLAERKAKHTKSCLMMNSGSGFGVMLKDGSFLQFDEAGHTRAFGAVQEWSKDKDLQVRVEGKRDGETLRVDRLSIQ